MKAIAQSEEYLALRSMALSFIDDHDEVEKVGSAMDSAYQVGIYDGLQKAREVAVECGVIKGGIIKGNTT